MGKEKSATSPSEGTAPYEGYPYRSPGPRYVDAPSVKPDDVVAWSKYLNLPKRPLRIDSVPLGDGAGSSVSSEPSRSPGPNPSSSKEFEQRPVVFIDIPDEGSSGVSMTREPDQEPDFVQETIFYDPFKDRRIDTPDSSPGTTTPRSGPARPDYLSLASPGSSGPGTSHSSSIPHYMSKETFIYGGDTPNDFDVSPLNIPAPPSYDSINREEDRQRQENTVETSPPPERPVEPPKTDVIVPGQTTITINGNNDNVVGLPLPDRKLLVCQFCGSTVNTLVVKETGCMNHFFACMLLFICFFLSPVVYLWDSCKYTNHYCPTCNEKVAYESPCPCSGLTMIQ
ncbi:uncharacterized protein LOC113234425 [Hyposmocoma kahamanoa]|uniref:uncharacterized protein LOC113234425 n=1 Tax=Hyposmocoma kahamanoa TaxID=1477025 RepID=UPI000E6D9593|nr:uncharacterized protein LOC113234425 [Hyposmocoma kahamanoa]